jgi:hypothetical protein
VAELAGFLAGAFSGAAALAAGLLAAFFGAAVFTVVFAAAFLGASGFLVGIRLGLLRSVRKISAHLYQNCTMGATLGFRPDDAFGCRVR